MNSSPALVLVSLLLVGRFTALPAVLPSPDFTAAREETVEMLRGFIQVDTTNPPGNDERIAIAGYGRFIEFLWWTVLDIAAAREE